MATLSNNKTLCIYNSKRILLELMKELGYQEQEYEQFSMNEIDTMYTNNQLDMLFTGSARGENNKTYIKYFFVTNSKTNQIKPNELDKILEDLFEIEQELTKSDALIIVIDAEPNQTILTRVKYLWDHSGIFVNILNLSRLQFNVLKHKLVPKGRVLTNDETANMMTKYNIMEKKQLPQISRFDPQAMAMCVRPGEVCEFIRNSASAMDYTYYRICV
jgi:DNA-directed RNA polymerase subunit H (RpoH/RPB5)